MTTAIFIKVKDEVVYQRKFEPSDNLQLSVVRALGAADEAVQGQLEQQYMVYTSSSLPVPSEQTLVGSNDIAVIAIAVAKQGLLVTKDELQEAATAKDELPEAAAAKVELQEAAAAKEELQEAAVAKEELQEAAPAWVDRIAAMEKQLEEVMQQMDEMSSLVASKEELQEAAAGRVDPLTAMGKQLHELRQQMRSLVAAFEPVAARHINSLARRIMLRIHWYIDSYSKDSCSEDDCSDGSCSDGERSEVPTAESISAVLGVEPCEFSGWVWKAGTYHENNQEHYDAMRREGSDKLVDDIHAAQAVIANMPSLKVTCSWECVVVQGFDAIWKAFPEFINLY